MLLEVIVTNVEEAVLAEKYGANRLELINDFALGGLSPDLQLTKEVCEAVKIPVNIMLRPHGNSFIYTNRYIDKIIKELDYIKNMTNANGIVFGALDKEGKIDTELLQNIISNKEHLQLVFHRAIDESKNILSAYEQLTSYKEIDLILTSGGKPTAREGEKIIKHMATLSEAFTHCQIMAGSGITTRNASGIINRTGVKQIHLGSGVRSKGLLDKPKFDKLLDSIHLKVT